MLIPRGAVPRLVAILVAISLLFAFITRTIHPANVNKVVLLHADPHDVQLPQSVELDGDVKWEQAVTMGGSIGPKKSMTVHVADISSAWHVGTVVLKDHRGSVIAAVPIIPHGRYGGTLVILIDVDRKARAAWNQVPPITDEEQVEAVRRLLSENSGQTVENKTRPQ